MNLRRVVPDSERDVWEIKGTSIKVAWLTFFASIVSEHDLWLLSWQDAEVERQDIEPELPQQHVTWVGVLGLVVCAHDKHINSCMTKI